MHMSMCVVSVCMHVYMHTYVCVCVLVVVYACTTHCFHGNIIHGHLLSVVL